MTDQVVLTGIKPTGTPHIGNYIGAIGPALRLASEPGTRAWYFVADYHALTSVHDRKELNRLVYEVAATWIALGLRTDAEDVLFYRQSDVPETFELAWVLACFCPKGWMNKAHAYKAKVAENREKGRSDLDAGVNMGLYAYPILMAADILLFDTDVVPVGQDQVQHVELARDMADRLNRNYGEDLLKLPEARISQEAAVVPGLDGRKMSKSYANTIPLFAPREELRKLVSRIVTDSTPPGEPKDPKTSSIFLIYSQIAPPEKTAELERAYRDGISWRDAKQSLFEMLDETLSAARETYYALLSDTDALDERLSAAAGRARVVARTTLDRVRRGVGIDG